MKVFNLFLLATCLLTIVSCKSDTSSVKSESDKSEKKIKISDFSNSPIFDDATLSNMTYKNGQFNFAVSGSTYALGQQTEDASNKMCANSEKGQHIHLIVDNNPYAAKYESSFKHSVADGDHYLLAFLSRSYHESIKTKSAHIAQVVQIKDSSIVEQKPIDQSMLFYSRPKGTYIGKDAAKVMLDYFLVNPVQGQYVVADINGTRQEFKQWKPYFLEGLPMGENTIELTLVDQDGVKLDVPNNPVSRTFTLKENPEEKM